MNKLFSSYIPLLGLLSIIPTFAQANSGDYTGAVAIGTSYAGVKTAPANGLIVQGNVGVGTASTTNALDIYGAVAIGTSYAGANTSPTSGLLVQGTVGIGTTSPYENVDVYSTNAFPTVLVEGGTTGDGAQVSMKNIGGQQYSVGSAGSASPYAPNSFYIYDNTHTQFRQVITNSGTVGIGTTAPRGGAQLDVNGSIYVATVPASASAVNVCLNGNVLSLCGTSARRYKANIEPSTLGLKEIMAMRPVTFDYKEYRNNWEKHNIGFIAEDMEKISPLFVTYDDKGVINGVRYAQLTAVNAKAIQELHETITAQQARIDSLEHAVEQLTHTSKPATVK